MKKLMLLFISLTMILGIASAQEPQDSKQTKRGDFIKSRVEKLKTELNLSDDQMVKIDALFKSQESQMKEIKKNDESSREERMQKMKQLKEERESALKKILTPDQFKKHEELRKEVMQKGREFKKNEGEKRDSLASKPFRKRAAPNKPIE